MAKCYVIASTKWLPRIHYMYVHMLSDVAQVQEVKLLGKMEMLGHFNNGPVPLVYMAYCLC